MRRSTQTPYTRPQLLEALQKLVEVRGEGVTLDEFCRQTGISSAPICRLFGGWSALRKQAGLSPRGKKPSAGLYTHQQLREMLVKAADVYGPQITLDQFRQAAGISATPIYHLFGSWPALQQAAGLPVRRRRWSESQLRAQQMARHVDALMDSPDAPLTLKELIARAELPRRDVEAEFGSWDNFLDYLFIETRGERLERLSEDDLLRLCRQVQRICARLEEEDHAAEETVG